MQILVIRELLNRGQNDFMACSWKFLLNSCREFPEPPSHFQFRIGHVSNLRVLASCRSKPCGKACEARGYAHSPVLNRPLKSFTFKGKHVRTRQSPKQHCAD